MTKIFRAMALSAAFVALVALGHGTARADQVNFNAAGVFSGTGTNTVTFTSGGSSTTLTYVSATNTVNTPGGTNFGAIRVTSTAPSGTSVPISGNFTLTINQTAPTSGSGSLSGVLAGSLGSDSGIGTLNFSTTSLTLGVFTYNLQPSYVLALPSTGGTAGFGETTLQGTVTGSAVPEPASMLLLGTGLAGLAGAARRRMKKDVE